MTLYPDRRAILATLLALVYPGLGHVYLRAWGRALLWFGAVIVTAIVLVPTEVFVGISSMGDLTAAWSDVPPEAAMGVLLVAVFNAADAYLTAKRVSVTPEDELRCPSCGRTVDEDLSFCHWCTAEFSVESA